MKHQFRSEKITRKRGVDELEGRLGYHSYNSINKHFFFNGFDIK